MNNTTLAVNQSTFSHKSMTPDTTWSYESNHSISQQYAFSGKYQYRLIEDTVEYLLTKLPVDLNFTQAQMMAVNKVKKFLEVQDIAITNHLFPSSDSLRDTMGTFVLRLLKNIYDNKIAPEIEKVKSVFKKMLDPIRGYISFDKKNNKIFIKIPDSKYAEVFKKDCQSWGENIQPADHQLLQNFFQNVDIWYTTCLVHNFSDNLSKGWDKSTTAIIQKLQSMQSSMNVKISSFTTYCDSKLNSKKPLEDNKATYFTYGSTRHYVERYVEDSLLIHLKSQMGEFERLMDLVKKKKNLQDNYFVL